MARKVTQIRQNSGASISISASLLSAGLFPPAPAFDSSSTVCSGGAVLARSSARLIGPKSKSMATIMNTKQRQKIA